MRSILNETVRPQDYPSPDLVRQKRLDGTGQKEPNWQQYDVWLTVDQINYLARLVREDFRLSHITDDDEIDVGELLLGPGPMGELLITFDTAMGGAYRYDTDE